MNPYALSLKSSSTLAQRLKQLRRRRLWQAGLSGVALLGLLVCAAWLGRAQQSALAQARQLSTALSKPAQAGFALTPEPIFVAPPERLKAQSAAQPPTVTIDTPPANWQPARLAAAAQPAASAASCTVDRLTDGNPGGGGQGSGMTGDLRYCMTQANLAGGSNTIGFSVTGTINLAGALPDISNSLTLNGPGPQLLTVRRATGGDYRIFHAPGGGLNIAISGLTIRDGRTSGFGGGIRSISQLTLDNCVFTNNVASSAGGGIAQRGNATFTNLTISNNLSGFQGGGIDLQLGGNVTLTNCTLSGNTASDTSAGAAISNLSSTFNNAPINLLLINCTLANNTNRFVSGIWTIGEGNFSATTRLKNTLVAGNNGPNFLTQSANATLVSQGYNLDSDGTSGFTNGVNGDIVGTPGNKINALLGPLADNGGPTQTHALLPGSPAIDQGSAGVTTDQRGQPRPFDFPGVPNAAGGNGSDIGAFELQCAELSALPNGAAGTTYNSTIAVAPAGSYTFSLVQGSLPSGLSLNPSTGVISGLPTVTGTYNFKVRAQAADGCFGTRAYTLQITCPTVSLSDLPTPTANTPYNQTVTASPAGGNYSFAVTGGSLPAGLSLNPATGKVSGTPTASGPYSFTITATGFGSCPGSRSYTGTIGSGGCPTITLPSSLPNGQTGQLYSQSVAATPAGSYSYTLSGTLPPGVTFYNAAALLFGYPTTAGSFSFTITATGANNCTAPQSYTVNIGAAAARAQAGDFDGDGKADTAVWRAQEANWLVVQSGNNALQTQSWGAPGDRQVAGDYDGDGKADMAVFSASGHWRIKRSSDGALVDKAWGLPTDVPVAGDYDGDKQTDIAVWRGDSGYWYIINSANGQYRIEQWGLAAEPYNDVAVPGDYDGDGKTDLAIFRRQNGAWYIRRSSDGAISTRQWGLATDTPVPGDYDGDGKTDIAVWRGGTGVWYIIRSSNGSVQTTSWGASYAPYHDVPVPGDYDGDGKTDIAIWRPSAGTWYSLNSRDGSVRLRQHGQAGDTPVTARQ